MSSINSRLRRPAAKERRTSTSVGAKARRVERLQWARPLEQGQPFAPAMRGDRLQPCRASFVSTTMPLRFWRIVSSIRSEEHTSELQSLMRISYAVFCLKKKKYTNRKHKLTHDISNTTVLLQTQYYT